MIAIQDYRFYTGKQLFKLLSVEYTLYILSFILAVITNSNWVIFNYIGFNQGSYLLDLIIIALSYGVIACLCNSLVGLYQNYMNLYLQEQYLRGLLGMTLLLVVLNNISYWFAMLDVGRYVWLASVTYSYIFFVINRIIFAVSTKPTATKSRTVILGTGNKALQLKQSLEKVVELQTVVVGYVHKLGERERLSREDIIDLVMITKTGNNLLNYCLENNINSIVVAVDDRRSNFPMTQLLECKQNGIVVMELMEFYEQELGRQQLDILDPSWVIYTNQLFQSKQQILNKTMLDKSIACLCLLLLAPLLLTIVILLKLSLGRKGKIFNKTLVTGLHSKPFSLYSFNCLNKKNNPSLIGKLINKLHLENSPVLLNIIKSQISFVGPQVVSPEKLDGLSAKIWYYKQRFAVKPGLIAWGYDEKIYDEALNQNNISVIKQQLEYDLFYIKKRSCLLDILVLIQTVFVLFNKSNFIKPRFEMTEVSLQAQRFSPQPKCEA